MDGEQRPFWGGLGARSGVAVPKHQQDSRSRQAMTPTACAGGQSPAESSAAPRLWGNCTRESRRALRRLCLTLGPQLSSTAGATALAAARRSCTLVGPTAAAFLPPQCGVGGVITATRMCGFSSDTYRRLFRLVGDLYDTSGGPVCSSSSTAAASARREGPCQHGVLFVPSAFARPRAGAATASRLTPSTRRPPAKRKQSTTLRPATPSSST